MTACRVITDYFDPRQPGRYRSSRLKVPNRTPLDLWYYEEIRRLVTGKRFCDVGSGCGDILDHVSSVAASVCGIEAQKSRQSKCPYESVVLGDFRRKGLPAADVYWWWFGSERDTADVLKMVRSGADVIFDTGNWNTKVYFWEQPTRAELMPCPSKDGLDYVREVVGFPVKYFPYYWEEDEDDVGYWGDGTKADWCGWRGVWIGRKP